MLTHRNWLAEARGLLTNPIGAIAVPLIVASALKMSHADTVVLIRFFEAQGRLRKAISILKHRGGGHEDAIRELRIDTRGIRVGQPLVDFRGVLTGTPEYFGAKQPLMEERD